MSSEMVFCSSNTYGTVPTKRQIGIMLEFMHIFSLTFRVYARLLNPSNLKTLEGESRQTQKTTKSPIINIFAARNYHGSSVQMFSSWDSSNLFLMFKRRSLLPPGSKL